jgi:predicted TIM-barrel fold metal-dependent hydrolase
MIIDSHTHIGRGEDFSNTYQVEQSLELLLQQMADCGIDRSCVMPVTYRDYEGGHSEIRDAVAAHPDKLIGYARANLSDEDRTLAQVRDCLEKWGFRGVKVHPWQGDGFPTRRLMELLTGYARPLLVHTRPEAQSMDGFAALARAYPRVPLMLGHMGGFTAFWPGYVKLCAVEARQIDNLYLDTARVFDHAWIKMAVDICGPEKVLFGTDACAAHPAITLKQIELCAFSDSERGLILGGNAQRLLGIR